MNFKLLITSVLALGVAIFFIIALFSRSGPGATTPNTQTNSQGNFPGSTQTTTTYQTGQTSTTSAVVAPGPFEVAAQDGSIIMTKDFLHNGITIPDTSNKGQYLLAGDLGYCVQDPQKCQAGGAKDFNIYYYENTKQFGIGLLDEPLGNVRARMEQFLMQDLGISQQDMCRLKYYVTTTSYVNVTYSGNNLGFSFCPGATPLPQ